MGVIETNPLDHAPKFSWYNAPRESTCPVPQPTTSQQVSGHMAYVLSAVPGMLLASGVRATR